MGRVLRSITPDRSNNAGGTFHTLQKSSVQNSPLNRKLVELRKNIPSVVQLKEVRVKLEDIGSSLSQKRRLILGDKTNRSTMPLINKENNGLHPATLKDKKTNYLLHEKKTEILSDFSQTATRLSSQKNKALKKISFQEELLLPVNTASGCTENSATNSSDLPKMCIYTKVQRETIRNKNMAAEEKLAQYEFEVDENEPVVKKKKKKNVKRKRKVKLYHPVKIAVKKSQQSSDAQKIEKVPNKVLLEQNLKMDVSKKISDNSNKSLYYKESSKSECSSPMQTINRKHHDGFMENISPISRPDGCVTLRKRKLQDFGEEISEMEISSCENTSHCNIRYSEKTPSRLSCPEISKETNELGELNITTINTTENGPLNESYHPASPARNKLCTDDSHKVSADRSSNKIQTCQTKVPDSECISSSGFSPLSSSKTVGNTSHSSVFNCANHRPVPLSRKVLFAPRVSGGVDSYCNKEVVERWNVDNCFGFEDESQETEPLSSLSSIILRQRLGRTLPFSSTPVLSSEKKSDSVSKYFKRKRGTTDELCIKSVKNAGTGANTENLLKTEKLNSTKSATLSPFSDPLKQSKLDFSSNSPKTPNGEGNVLKNGHSPLLFKDIDDKTPIHFKEPARRSYVRTVRKKLKPIGGEWIEIDSDAEQEENKHSAIKKKKKEKFNKQEEKEANQWMKKFNMQCGEIEHFQLCVE